MLRQCDVPGQKRNGQSDPGSPLTDSNTISCAILYFLALSGTGVAVSPLVRQLDCSCPTRRSRRAAHTATRLDSVADVALGASDGVTRWHPQSTATTTTRASIPCSGWARPKSWSSGIALSVAAPSRPRLSARSRDRSLRPEPARRPGRWLAIDFLPASW
jgi:hypothetical protein